MAILAVSATVLTPASGDPGGPSPQNTGATPLTEAARIYGVPQSELDLHQVQSAAYVQAFPLFEFYYVTEGDGGPGESHIMAYEDTTDVGYDATVEYNTLLSLSGALVNTSSKALLFGKAYAEVANAEPV